MFNRLFMFRIFPVGKIEPCHIHPGGDHLSQNSPAARRRPYCGHYLGLVRHMPFPSGSSLGFSTILRPSPPSSAVNTHGKKRKDVLTIPGYPFTNGRKPACFLARKSTPLEATRPCPFIRRMKGKCNRKSPQTVLRERKERPLCNSQRGVFSGRSQLRHFSDETTTDHTGCSASNPDTDQRYLE